MLRSARQQGLGNFLKQVSIYTRHINISGLLLSTEALALTALTHIFIDTTYRDEKKRSMMDIPETRDEVFLGVLGRENIRAAFHSGKTQLVLF